MSEGSHDRLAPIAELIDAARAGSANFGALLASSFPGLDARAEDIGPMTAGFLGEPYPSDLGWGGVVVWRDVALFAVSSARQPALSIDGGETLPLAPVPGTPYWFRLETIEPGRLHLYRYGVDGVWAPGSDFAGYTEGSYEFADVKRGSISDRRTVSSRIYPGAVTEYWLYANHGIDERRGAPLMVWHDGAGCLEPNDLFGLRMQLVTDNLVHLGLIPPMVHVLVSPSSPGEELPTRFPGEDQANAMRSLQYDSVSDRYGWHLASEVLPNAGQVVKLRSDGYSRGSAGGSSGGICAFKVAWFRPEHFSRVHSVVGSFTGLQWDPGRGSAGGFMLSNLVRREPRRNIRVWMSGGANDLEVGPDGRHDLYVAGSWPLNNIQLANALKLSGYDFRFRFGEGFHSGSQAALDLPESLAWLWRDYDPGCSEQTFEQERSERDKPVFRVRIANRDT